MRNLSILMLFIGAMLNAQFNTVTYWSQEDSESLIDTVTLATQEKPKKKLLQSIFGKSESRALKEQNDSLKAVLNYYNNKTTIENNLLLKQIQVQLQSSSKPNKKTVESNSGKQFQLIKESRRVLSMPLSRELFVTSSYGNRVHPISGAFKHHNGVDFRANYENVLSVLDGVVTETAWDGKGGGYYVKIKHSNRFETSYLHLSEILCKRGDLVQSGDVIAISGNTGNSTAPHLHFAVKEYGRYINPIDFLNQLINYNNLITNHLNVNSYE